VYAPNLEVEQQKKVEAFNRVEIFTRVLTHYRGRDLPEMKYLGNTLEREFGLAPEYHEEFSKLFSANCKYLDIGAGAQMEAAADRPRTVVVGEPVGKSKLKAFVIIPFGERDTRPPGFFAEVLNSLITPAGTEASFTVETANRQGSEVIQSTIINELLDADLVIADLTDHNPNVMFELGVRLRDDKPVALIKAKGTGRVFDIDNMLRVFEYSPNLWRTTVEADLPELIKHIKATWENRKNEQTYMKILRSEGRK
jgi:nucleoside 2-deoxyribosyltransferase